MNKARALAALALMLLPLSVPLRAEVVTDQSRIDVSVPQIPSSERIDFPTSTRTRSFLHEIALH